MQAFAGFSTNQELAKRVSYLGALAPVAYLVKIFGIAEFSVPSKKLQDLIGDDGCVAIGKACKTAMSLLMGPLDNVNSSRLHVYNTLFPGSTSVKNMAHFAQGIRKGTFAAYDYGCSCNRFLPLAACPTSLCKNKRVYDAFDPPTFSLESVQYPRMGFYVGSKDWFATEPDISKLRSHLPPGTIVEEKLLNFGHLDFPWAHNANEKVYKDLIASIKKYEGLGYY